MSRHFRARTVLAAASCSLLLTLGACGDDAEDTAQDTAGSPTPTVTDSATDSATPTSTPSPDDASPGAMPGKTAALVRAGQTGLAEVGKGAVYSVEEEDEDDRAVWEVQVVTPDGTKHELYVSRDGRSVVRAPKAEERSAKYRQRVQAAKLDFEQAVRAILDEVPGAVIEELGLDTEDGTVVWEADAQDGSGTDISLEIDAATGAVHKHERDS